MAKAWQLRSLIFTLSLGAATAALAIAFMLVVVVRQPAQAQTFNALHTLSGGGDGVKPAAGGRWKGTGNLQRRAANGGNGRAYPQSSVGTVASDAGFMGSEWVTRMAAIELLGYTPPDAQPSVLEIPDPNDPRAFWKLGRAKNLDLSDAQTQKEVARIKGQLFDDENLAAVDRYKPRYKLVYDAIVGQRWVDLAGFDAPPVRDFTGRGVCHDAVAREPADVQYDHFLRRYDDSGGEGGRHARDQSQERLIKYFVDAAMAPPEIISVYDGGADGAGLVDVDRNYFLFGRALHLFEDSFSSEHTVRTPDDVFTSVRQVKSNLCAAGSEQHSRSTAEILDYTSGDVVWLPGTVLDPLGTWREYRASEMKTEALVATEATKDLWAAFIRTMGTPMDQRKAKAQNEALSLSGKWLAFNVSEMKAWYDDEAHRDETYVLAPGQSGKGQTVQACMLGLNLGTGDQAQYVRQLEKTRQRCLWNAKARAGYEDLFDPSLHLWFSWEWKDRSYYLPPREDWPLPDLPADSGIRVRIRSVANGEYMGVAGGNVPEAPVYCGKPKPPNPTNQEVETAKPIDFILVGPLERAVLRVADAPRLFLGYESPSSDVKDVELSESRAGANFTYLSYKISRVGPGIWSIIENSSNQYMYFDDEYKSVDIRPNGNASDPHAQWKIEGLPLD